MRTAARNVMLHPARAVNLGVNIEKINSHYTEKNLVNASISKKLFFKYLKKKEISTRFLCKHDASLACSNK